VYISGGPKQVTTIIFYFLYVGKKRKFCEVPRLLRFVRHNLFSILKFFPKWEGVAQMTEEKNCGIIEKVSKLHEVSLEFAGRTIGRLEELLQTCLGSPEIGKSWKECEE
jgi:hypothetical protein